MSSRPKLRSKAAANGNTETGEGGKVASKVSADDEPLRSPHTNSNGDMGKVVANGKASSENSDLQDPLHPLPPQHANDSQSDAASVASAASHSVGGTATRTTTRTRSTRSRTNSTGQRHKDTHYQAEVMPHNSSGTEEDRNTYVDALASTLARLDEDAYKSAVLQDANALLENVVFPMSFPWAHPIGPVIRTIPRDIDEMPAIQRIDDPEHEVCSLKHSNFDLAKHLFSFTESEEALDEEEEIRAVARRADNPGVIEMITCAPPLTSLKGTDPSAGSSSAEGKRSVLLRDPIVETSAAPGLDNSLRHDATDKIPPGELSYRIFKESQEKKRRKLESGMARLKTSVISVRVGSTSSRPLLFDKSESKARLPLLLPAVLPPEFRPIAKGKNAARNQQPGRSKLIWLDKVSSRTSRVSFSSYLTNEKVESGMHKRPRDVLVGIRVNGKLLTSPKANINLASAPIAQDSTSSKRKRDGKAVSVYSTKVVSEALDNAFAGLEPRLGTRQCSLDTEEFAKRILASEVNKDRSMGWNVKVTIKGLNTVYVTPRIDCLPSEEGLLHVVCTSPGELQPTNVDDVLQYAAKRKSTPVCTVCWRDTSTSGEKVQKCADCGITVHSNCCKSSDTDLHPKWKCSVCAQNTVSSTSQSRQHESNSVPSPNERASRRSSRVKEGNSPAGGKNGPSCFLCPHRGGSMSLLKRGGRTVWAHDLCRIWCDQATDSGSGGKTIPDRTGLGLLICALCGASNPSGDLVDCNGIIKCAATGCSVHFHPMCALFLSKCEERRLESMDYPSKGSHGSGFAGKSHRAERELSDSRLAKIIEEDKQLCRQFSLEFAQCHVPGSSPTSVRLPATTLLPVCFCGIHNPNRDRSLYGLYPGGQQVDAHVMRVPSKKINK